MTPQEYLSWEESQPVRHEYLDGQVFAVAGASPEHNDIVATGLYTYPDVLVVCGEAEYEDEKRTTLQNPTVIVEVLSESTESYDRGKKFQHYRSIPSLRDHLLVAQDTVWVEHYVRGGDGTWILRDTLPGGTVRLASCGVELKVDELYLKVFEAS